MRLALDYLAMSKRNSGRFDIVRLNSRIDETSLESLEVSSPYGALRQAETGKYSGPFLLESPAPRLGQNRICPWANQQGIRTVSPKLRSVEGRAMHNVWCEPNFGR